MIIHFVFFLIFFVTVINLFYKPYWIERQQRQQKAGVWNLWASTSRHGSEASLCHLRGYRCEDSQCDCESICGDKEVEKMQVLQGEEVILHDVRLSPGTYCVPKEKEEKKCNRRSSRMIYSASGWFCQNKPLWKGDYMTACKSSKATDNSLNVLIDRSNGGKEVVDFDKIEDFYEALDEGGFRYECRCGSLDVQGNRMVNVIPFVCSGDYCVKDLTNVPSLGHYYAEKPDKSVVGACACGPYAHANPNDESSPCVATSNRIENDEFVGRVECMNADSYLARPFYCKRNLSALEFRKKIYASDYPLDFVLTHKDRHKVLVSKDSEEIINLR